MAGLTVFGRHLAFFLLCLLFSGSLAKNVPAIFIFGDSTADVGNNNFLPHSQAKANFLPNGIDFEHSRPTGRFSNGLNTADLVAQKLGFKKSPPPFLSLTRARQALKGANFASAGSGIHEDTGRRLYGERLSLPNQLQLFSELRSVFRDRLGSAATEELFSKSLFFISTGSNDLIDIFAAGGSSISIAQKTAYIESLVKDYKFQLQTLYKLGARKVGVISPPPVGCCPSQRVFNASGGCLDGMNELSLMFYEATDAMLKELSYELHGLKYSHGNLFKMVADFLHKASSLGFTELESACCGAGRFNGQKPCLPNSAVCVDRKKFLFWDWFHPTEAACKVAAETLFTGEKEFVSPINFAQLAAC